MSYILPFFLLEILRLCIIGDGIGPLVPIVVNTIPYIYDTWELY